VVVAVVAVDMIYMAPIKQFANKGLRNQPVH
jgi:hypothetical protein